MLPLRPEEGEIRRFILRKVLRNVRCSACGARYAAEDIAIIENRGGVWVLMAVCSGCGTQSLIMVVVQEKQPEEESLPALTEDDVLTFHSFISKFDSDFREMFGSGETPGGLLGG
mgnify:CR=1 FL=1